MLYWLNGAFESEYYMVDSKKQDGEYRYKARKCQLPPAIDDMYFDDKTTIRFGVLNSKDIYTDQDNLQEAVELIEKYLLLEENKSLNLQKIVFLKSLIKVFKEDIA